MPTDLDKPPGTPPEKPPSWWTRLDDTKVTPRIAVLFFLGLVVLSGMAAGVGFVAQHFRAAVSRAR